MSISDNGKYKVDKLTYILDADIFKEYGLQINDIKPLRNAYIIYTDKGVKFLKRLRAKSDDSNFPYDVIHYLNEKEFTNTENINKTLEGKEFVEKDDGKYILSDAIEGRECDFKNPVELERAIKLMAKMHNASKGFKVPKSSGRYRVGKWSERFEESLSVLKSLKEVICKKNTLSEIDEIFLQWVPFYELTISESIERLNESNYYEICQKFSEEGGICHNDFIERNFIIDKDSEVFFIDFDYCIEELKEWDIAKAVLRVAKDNVWDIDIVKTVIEKYQEVYELSKDELYMIYILISYPFDFINIVRNYYIDKKNWTEKQFYDDIKRKVEYEESKVIFLNDFKTEFLR